MNKPIIDNVLPITRPLEDISEIDDLYFYINVVQPLIPDIIKLMYNGIPINMDNVDKLEEALSSILDLVNFKLKNNPLIIQWLENTYNKTLSNKIKDIDAKKKTVADFFKSYNHKDKVQRTYLINYYLTTINRTDLYLKEWSIKDLKKLNQILASNFINNLVEGNIESFMYSTIDIAMYKLAEEKLYLYNKNKIDSKIKDFKEKLKESLVFNPASSTQKAQFLSSLGIESDEKTPTGNDKWDRDELEKLQKLINQMLENKDD